jgi:SAGA-associated factor 73
VEKKKKRSESPAAALGSPSSGAVVNPLDDTSRDTFSAGLPLDDPLPLQQCKHCKKGILKNAAKEHIAQCLKIKKEKAQRKKEAREARERAKEEARQEEARKNDPDGDTQMNDDSDDDDDEKKGTGGKANKKVGGKKPDGEAKGKKRKAEGDADKGPKSKKKKEEPKPKVPKPKGITPSTPNSLVGQFVNPCLALSRSRGCRETMRCHPAKWPTLCSISNVQESFDGRQTCGARAFASI